MINTLREKNKKLLLKFELEKKEMEFLKQRVIFELLKNDNCFFEIPVETAFNILSDLQYDKDEIKQIYLKLTKPKD